MGLPAPGKPGHGRGHVTVQQLPHEPDFYQVICPDCGDDPERAYAEVSPELQAVRGQFVMWRHAKRHADRHAGVEIW